MTEEQKKITRLDSNYIRQYDAYIERQKRRKQKLIRRLVLLSVIVLITFGSLATYHVKQRMLHAEKSEQYEQLEKELEVLHKEEEKHLEEISLLQDEEYVLEIARTNYFFSKQGELIFKMPDESPSY